MLAPSTAAGPCSMSASASSCKNFPRESVAKVRGTISEALAAEKGWYKCERDGRVGSWKGGGRGALAGRH